MTSSEFFRLDGKVALVTGGTGVLCTPMCRALAAAGAKVVVLALEDDKVAALAQEIKQNGGEAIGIKSDVLDKAALEAAAEQVAATYGRIDILVNGAGGNRPDATTMPGQRTFFDIPQEALRWVFDLNFTGAMLASQVFGKFMVEQGSGAILNISSMAAYSPMTRVVAYAAAKAAISNFTQWLAVYMATEHSPEYSRQRHCAGLLPRRAEPLPADRRSDRRADRARSADHRPSRRRIASACRTICSGRCSGWSATPRAS